LILNLFGSDYHLCVVKICQKYEICKLKCKDEPALKSSPKNKLKTSTGSSISQKRSSKQRDDQPHQKAYGGGLSVFFLLWRGLVLPSKKHSKP